MHHNTPQLSIVIQPHNKPTQITQQEAIHHDALIAERSKAIEEIAQDIEEINDMMQMMNKLVTDQEAPLNQITENINSSAQATQNATTQLKKAREHQRRKQCIMM